METAIEWMIPGYHPTHKLSTLTVNAPYDGSTLAILPCVDDPGLDHGLEQAQMLFQQREKWLPLHRRLAILQQFQQLLSAQRQSIAKTAAMEGGKPLRDSLVEVDRAIDGVQIAVETLRTTAGEVVPMRINAATEHRLAFTQKEPIGVVLAISAFNHPVNLIIHQVIPAIAAGCPVLVKPASATPLSCLTLVQLLREAGLPEAWCQVVICSDNEQTSRLASDARLDFVTFIGSAKVGWALRNRLAPGVRCALEHGGVAPVIVHQDADLDEAVPLLAKGGFYHAGQVCVSVQRVYVHEAIADALASRLSAAAKAQRIGDPTDSKTDVGPLIRAKEVARVDEWVKAAVDAGATLMCGGHPVDTQGYACTVLLDPPESTLVSHAEIFGPVICLYRYQSLDAAIAQANALPYAFQAAVFTQHLDTALYCYQQLQAATVMINDHTAFRADWMPFAGLKHSGHGTGGIPYTLQDMQTEKLMVLRSNAL